MWFWDDQKSNITILMPYIFFFVFGRRDIRWRILFNFFTTFRSELNCWQYNLKQNKNDFLVFVVAVVSYQITFWKVLYKERETLNSLFHYNRIEEWRYDRIWKKTEMNILDKSLRMCITASQRFCWKIFRNIYFNFSLLWKMQYYLRICVFT